MRSYLFVPGHDERKLAKSLQSGADALILDLEDAVAPAYKIAARATTTEFVKAHRHELPLIVRVNALDTGLTEDDLEAVVPAHPNAIMLPKCRGGHDVMALGKSLDALEARAGLAVGSFGIIPVATESALATLNCASYAALPSPRLRGLLWGGEDLAADIGSLSNRDASGNYSAPFQLARSMALLGATAAQVPAIDAVNVNIRDLAGLRAEALEAVRDGFGGKAAIHPDQVAVINEVFTPTAAQAERAQRIIAAYEAAPAQGVAVVDGLLIDLPHYRIAKRLMAKVSRT